MEFNLLDQVIEEGNPNSGEFRFLPIPEDPKVAADLANRLFWYAKRAEKLAFSTPPRNRNASESLVKRRKELKKKLLDEEFVYSSIFQRMFEDADKKGKDYENAFREHNDYLFDNELGRQYYEDKNNIRGKKARMPSVVNERNGGISPYETTKDAILAERLKRKMNDAAVEYIGGWRGDKEKVKAEFDEAHERLKALQMKYWDDMGFDRDYYDIFNGGEFLSGESYDIDDYCERFIKGSLRP